MRIFRFSPVVMFVFGLALIGGCSDSSNGVPARSFDLLIKNGRVMDPATGLDQAAHVLVAAGKITEIIHVGQDPSLDHAEPVSGKVLDASGLVVAPGFIDIHSHEGVDEETFEKTMRVHLQDGVTTVIGGNCGGHLYPLDDYFKLFEMQGLLTNFASYAGHERFRYLVGIEDPLVAATPEQIDQMVQLAEGEMAAGAFGISYGLAYTPGASYDEVLALGHVAAGAGGLTSAHGRAAGVIPEALAALEEMIQLVRDTGAPHQYSHIGSMLAYGTNMALGLERIAQAQAEGLSINGDVYGYTAASTMMSAEIFSEGVFERLDCTPKDMEAADDVVRDGVVLLSVGDRFDSVEQFHEVRNGILAGEVNDVTLIAHIMDPEKVRLAMQSKYICICSDGSANPGGAGHPRVAGAFSRFLGKWVRDEGTTDLMTALEKTSTMAARILGLKGKGTLSPGSDADITVFNHDTIIDHADFGTHYLDPSTGIAYVIVNGAVALVDGSVVEDVRAGRPIRRTWKVPGYLATVE